MVTPVGSDRRRRGPTTILVTSQSPAGGPGRRRKFTLGDLFGLRLGVEVSIRLLCRGRVVPAFGAGCLVERSWDAPSAKWTPSLLLCLPPGNRYLTLVGV